MINIAFGATAADTPIPTSPTTPDASAALSPVQRLHLPRLPHVSFHEVNRSKSHRPTYSPGIPNRLLTRRTSNPKHDPSHQHHHTQSLDPQPIKPTFSFSRLTIHLAYPQTQKEIRMRSHPSLQLHPTATPTPSSTNPPDPKLTIPVDGKRKKSRATPPPPQPKSRCDALHPALYAKSAIPPIVNPPSHQPAPSSRPVQITASFPHKACKTNLRKHFTIHSSLRTPQTNEPTLQTSTPNPPTPPPPLLIQLTHHSIQILLRQDPPFT